MKDNFDKERCEIQARLIKHQEIFIEQLMEIIKEYEKMSETFSRAAKRSMN